jgi:hypothetical protein
MRKMPMKYCKMFYDMGYLGFEEFEFETWDEAFNFWREKKPPGPLVQTIYLLNLRGIGYKIEVKPPEHPEVHLPSRDFRFKPFDRNPEYYRGEKAMRRGVPIKNWYFDEKAYEKAVEEKNGLKP